MRNLYREINVWIAINVTNGFGTMECAWLLLVWGLSPLFIPALGNVVSYVSQDIIQLVALSVIMVGQRIQENKISKLHEKHDDLHAEIRKLTEKYT